VSGRRARDSDRGHGSGVITLAVSIVRDLAARRRMDVDAIALWAMSGAIALGSSAV
jgi:hypothetical protein